jgi:hypothetical protein
MGSLPWIIILVLLEGASLAATDRPPSEAPQRESFAVGLLATPALEGGGPWFMPTVRISAPLGAKHSVDLDAGRIFGGSNDYAEIRTFVAGQIRFARKSREARADARYWLVGLKYLSMKQLDGQGTFLRHNPDTALTVGHGWKQTFRNGLRAVNELGFSGGRGFIVYASIGVQWGIPPRK